MTFQWRTFKKIIFTKAEHRLILAKIQFDIMQMSSGSQIQQSRSFEDHVLAREKSRREGSGNSPGGVSLCTFEFGELVTATNESLSRLQTTRPDHHVVGRSCFVTLSPNSSSTVLYTQRSVPSRSSREFQTTELRTDCWSVSYVCRDWTVHVFFLHPVADY